MQWEYFRMGIAPMTSDAVKEDENMHLIQDFGAHGWELVTIVAANGGTPVAYFKRQKQNAAFVDIAAPQ